MSNSGKDKLIEWTGHAYRQGWTVIHGKRHLKWYDPAGRLAVTTPHTPGGGRSTINNRAALRRAGLRGIR